MAALFAAPAMGFALPAASSGMFATSAAAQAGTALAPAAASTAQAAAAASTASSTAATMDAFVKGLGALGGLATMGTSISAAVKGTKKPSDPMKRQQELARRLIAQRAGQREGGIGSTRLTGPLGDLSVAPTGKRTLLGG